MNWKLITEKEFDSMANENYSASKTIVKGVVPLLIPVISEAIVAATAGAGIDMNKTAVYSGVSFLFGAVVSFKNWLKNRKK
jgi:hypothetical protein